MSQELMPNNGGTVSVTPPTQTTTTTQTDGSGGTPQPTTPPATPAQAQDPLTMDIDGLLKKARADEKTKLYTRIERAEAERDAARAQISTLTEKIEALSEKITASTSKETPPKKADQPEDINAVIDAAARTTLERAEKEIFGPRIAELEARLAEQTQRAEQIDLDAYRKSLIDANRGTIIEELVTGTTRDALDEALIKAKQIFARTAEALKSRVDAATSSATGNIPPVPPVTQGTSQVAPTGTDPLATLNVGKMTDKEYREKRAEILRQASAAARARIETQP
jgi:uncharacterized coiled-coil protein SlyX